MLDDDDDGDDGVRACANIVVMSATRKHNGKCSTILG